MSHYVAQFEIAVGLVKGHGGLLSYIFTEKNFYLKNIMFSFHTAIYYFYFFLSFIICITHIKAKSMRIDLVGKEKTN